MKLLLLGLNHRTAPVAVRERYAVAPTDLEGLADKLRRRPGVAEAALVSTCNRTEALVSGAAEDVVALVRRRLFRNLADEHLHVYRGVHAVIHLFRVASGLDSLVIGE